MKKNSEDTILAFGYASILPGVERCIDVLKNFGAEIRSELSRLQSVQPLKAKRGRKKDLKWTPELEELEAVTRTPAVEVTAKKANLNRRGKPVAGGYWSQFTPEQRKAEMKRRHAVRRGEAPSRNKRKAVAA